MVGRLVRDQKAVGSSPTSPTFFNRARVLPPSHPFRARQQAAREKGTRLGVTRAEELSKLFGYEETDPRVLQWENAGNRVPL